jgi:hypothetical protein
LTDSYAGAASARANLAPEQEFELVKYIEQLSGEGLSPTRAMIKNFASFLAKKDVSERWVGRFLKKHSGLITNKYVKGMDRNRHKADSYDKYRLYFELLHSKISKYNISPDRIYNMDEKGFLIGVLSKSKRVFSKAKWERREVREALQDGSREFITVLACICADGTSLEPSVIFAGKQGLRSAWVEDVEAGEHEVFFSNTPTGWSNDDIGFSWLEQVFDRVTKEKAGRGWRLLILDGHGSHLTQKFKDYCELNRIFLLVFPPHSTHSLQPLDVVMFSPLSGKYSQNLEAYLYQTQGLVPVTKGDFFPLFWDAYNASFTPENILKSFEVVGISPPDASPVLNRFISPPSPQDGVPKLADVGDGGSWTQLRKLYYLAIKDTSKVSALRLYEALHSLQVQNELLHHRNEAMKEALSIKQKHAKKSRLLPLIQRQEYDSGAVWWSPGSLREARVRDKVFRREEEQEKLRKSDEKELKKAAALYKKKQQQAAKELRESAAEARKKDAEAKAREREAARVQKQQEKDAATTRNLVGPLKRALPTTSQSVSKRSRRGGGAVGGANKGAAASPPSPPPTRTTTRGRSINLPAKFR